MIKEDLINPRDVNTEQKAVNFTEIASVSDRDDETRGIFQCLKFFGFSGEITPKRKSLVSFRTKKLSKKRKTLN